MRNERAPIVAVSLIRCQLQRHQKLHKQDEDAYGILDRGAMANDDHSSGHHGFDNHVEQLEPPIRWFLSGKKQDFYKERDKRTKKRKGRQEKTNVRTYIHTYT